MKAQWIAVKHGPKTFIIGRDGGPSEYIIRPADGLWREHDYTLIQRMLDGLNQAERDAELKAATP